MNVPRRPAGKLPWETPLTWAPILLTGDGPARKTATLSCGNGHSATLEDHEIAPDGTVSPSVVCPYPLCGWHENVVLDGWEP